MSLADFTTVPDGTYRVRVHDVRPGTTRAGDERWSLHLFVVDGPHAGKPAAWDSITFNARGKHRARRVLTALGLWHPERGTSSVDLLGREAVVEVRTVAYQAPTGQRVRRNEVPFHGWRTLPLELGGGS